MEKFKYFKAYKDDIDNKIFVSLDEIRRLLNGLPYPDEALQALREMGSYNLPFSILYAEPIEDESHD